LQPNPECPLIVDDRTCQLDVKFGESLALSFADLGHPVPMHHTRYTRGSWWWLFLLPHCQAVPFSKFATPRLDCEALHVPIEVSEFENEAMVVSLCFAYNVLHMSRAYGQAIERKLSSSPSRGCARTLLRRLNAPICHRFHAHIGNLVVFETSEMRDVCWCCVFWRSNLSSEQLEEMDSWSGSIS
jgi:hypothetical protein